MKAATSYSKISRKSTLRSITDNNEKNTEFLRTKKTRHQDTNIVTEKDVIKDKIMEKIAQEIDKIKHPEKYKAMGPLQLSSGKKTSRIPSVHPIISLISIDKDKVKKMFAVDPDVRFTMPEISNEKSSQEILQNLK